MWNSIKSLFHIGIRMMFFGDCCHDTGPQNLNSGNFDTTVCCLLKHICEIPVRNYLKTMCDSPMISFISLSVVRCDFLMDSPTRGISNRQNAAKKLPSPTRGIFTRRQRLENHSTTGFPWGELRCVRSKKNIVT